MSASPTDETSGKTPRQRFLELSPERKAQILDPAQEEFARHGFADASLNHILKRAHMSKGQSYYYFSNKEELYFAVLERAYAHLNTKVQFTFGHPQTPRDYWAQIESLLSRVNEVLATNAELAAVALRVNESDKTRAIVGELPIRRAFEELLVYGQNIGAIRADLPDDLLQNTIIAMAIEINRWFTLKWHELDMSTLVVLNHKALKLFEATCFPDEE